MSETICLLADNGKYWRVRYGIQGLGAQIAADGTEEDRKDQQGPCWFIMEDQIGGVVTLRVKETRSGEKPLYLGMTDPFLLAWDGWGNEQPTFRTTIDYDHILFQAIGFKGSDGKTDVWLGRLNLEFSGDVIGLKNAKDEYCRFKQIT